MKKSKNIGKLIIAIGVLTIFLPVKEQSTFGGFYSNRWGIIITSLSLILIGLLVNLKSNK